MIKKILIVDDEESVRYSFKRFLNADEYQVDTAVNGKNALAKFGRQSYDLIILDIRLPDMSGLEVLQKIRMLDPRAVVLIITAFGTTETAIEATKLGAYDYILKPFDIPKIKDLIEEALRSSYLMKTRVLVEEPPVQGKESEKIIGKSPLMQEVYKMIGRVSGSEVNVLIRGESGTGKELVARAIYHHSPRANKLFLAVNCAAIPETLLESELFGYEKGAFTGAVRRRIGKFEQADGGTIFLDEIGDMTLSTQAKILRVLQEGCFEHLGGEETIHVNVRIIAATNRNLEKAIEMVFFREDLYYRLKVVTISLPPLRQRQQDIPELVNYFLEKHSAVHKKHVDMDSSVMEKLIRYHWPGNIRELENVISRAIVLCKGNIISENLIGEEFQSEIKPTEMANENASGIHITDSDFEAYKGKLYEKVMEQTERELILRVLKRTGGNQVQASKILGISRVMLRDRILKYGIKNEIIVK